MRALPYWQRNPDIREYALKVDESGASRKQVLVALAEKFGELAPADESLITRLRMGAARGDWNARPVAPRKESAATDKADPVTGTPFDIKGNRRQRLYPRHWRFWEAQPSIREFAIRIILEQNLFIQRAIKARFGDKAVPTEEQITLLRNRITTKNQWTHGMEHLGGQRTEGAPAPKPLSEAAERLFSNEQATECQIPGIKLLTRLQCLKHQLNKRLMRSETYLNGAISAAETRRVVIPELMFCAKCLNYLSHTDLRLIQRGLKKGLIALEATK
jgi:hypothetical protein